MRMNAIDLFTMNCMSYTWNNFPVCDDNDCEICYESHHLLKDQKCSGHDAMIWRTTFSPENIIEKEVGDVIMGDYQDWFIWIG